MNICIVGAGAVGGLIGTRLAATGAHRVSALARGQTLAALRQYGWRVQSAQTLADAHLAGKQCTQAALHLASDRAHELGVQDVVILAVKSQALPDLAPTLTPLLDQHTLIVPAMNGVPWWFMQKEGAALSLQSVDPRGTIAASLPLAQVLGCVVHLSASTSAPGLVQHHAGQKLMIGECTSARPDARTARASFGAALSSSSSSASGAVSARVLGLVQVFSDAGFEAMARDNIRADIWYKLWGNMTLNPITAMTGATVDKVLADPLTRAFISAVMLEAQAIGERIGCTIAESPQERHQVTAKLGAFKTSMLQDVEAARSIELDALVTVVREIGQHVGVATPNLDALLGLTRVFAQTKNLYPLT